MTKPKKKSVRDLLHELQSGICYYCHRWYSLDAFSVDHRVPTSRGGSNRYDNKVGCCKTCNRSKGLLTEQEFKDTPREHRKPLQARLQKEYELRHGIVNPNAKTPPSVNREAFLASV